jgi:anti-sigma regulatory factor (Ser/Thr protein kinase)
VSLLFAGAEPLEQTRVIAVPDASHVGEARRTVGSLSARLGLDEINSGKVAIVATELATNLAKHGGGGTLLVRAVEEGTGIELIAVDKGHGISNIERAMRDGYSSGGTAGAGLGAVNRMSQLFDIYSTHSTGTVVLSRMLKLRPVSRPVVPDKVEFGVVCIAAPGERVSGDAWIIVPGETGPAIVVIDALGHGDAAHEAAVRALDICRRNAGASAVALIEAMHRALKSTRGAAVAIAELDESAQSLRFAGIGNISCSITSATGSRSFASLGGIVGHDVRRVQPFTDRYTVGDSLVMFSDGIATRWRLDQYPGLRPHHPSIAAAIVHRDYLRGRDDATIFVARLGASQSRMTS